MEMARLMAGHFASMSNLTFCKHENKGGRSGMFNTAVLSGKRIKQEKINIGNS